MRDSPPFWAYAVVVIAGVVLFFGAVYCLVMTVRTTGLGQFYWAFNFVTVVSAVGLLLTVFAVEKKR